MSEEHQGIEVRDGSDDRKDAPLAAALGPVAKEKAAREKHWARGERREAREDDLRRHWEENYVADVEKRGGLAALIPDPPPPARGYGLSPPPDREPRPLPQVPQTDGPARYRKPASPPDDAETELAAMIAECRHFMRGVAFESARMTPSVADRLQFIGSACRLAEASAKVGKSVAGLRSGRETSVREVFQRIRVEDTRRGEGEGA
jgi:hypothetical protein